MNKEPSQTFDLEEFAEGMHASGLPFIVIDGSIFEDLPEEENHDQHRMQEMPI